MSDIPPFPPNTRVYSRLLLYLRNFEQAYVVLCLKPAIQYAVFNRLKAVVLAYQSGKAGWGETKELTAVQVCCFIITYVM